MARNITVYFADGSRHEYQGVPDDATPEQVAARAGRDFQGKQIRHIERAPALETETSDTTRNPFMGALARGAELVGSGIETLGRAGEAIGDIIAEKAPILDTRLMIDREGIRLERPTEEDIRDKNQLQYMQDWADSFRNWGREINYEPSTKLGELADNPLNAVPFIVERVIASSPDMVAAATALPAYIPTRANEILNERLKNDDRSLSEATIGDVAAATGAAVVEGTLERFATRRLVKEGAEAATATRRIGKEAAIQAGTEAAEEVGAYAGETAGTRAGFDPRTAGLTALEAAIVGGGLGAGAQGVKEIFGTRPGEPTTEEAVTEEEEFPSAEALAPKEGRVARPSPVRAKTLEELRGQMPAAPKIEDEVKAPREPMVFERTKEPTPEAVQEATEFATQFPEGGKDFNLFKARSIAKKLGYEGVTNKSTRADVEPLIRSALAPRETITPAEDVVVGQNAAGEPLYERQDGSRYRMRFDRADRPAGYPDFGGDLAPVEAGQEVTVPETAQIEPVEPVTPAPAAEIAAPEPITTEVPKASPAPRISKPEAIKSNFGVGAFNRITDTLQTNLGDVPATPQALKELPSTQLADLMSKLREVKPRPLEKMFGKSPTEEQQAEYKALSSTWQSQYNKVSAAQKIALERDNAAFRAAQAVGVPSEPTRAGVSEAVAGAGARGAELPVPRVGAAGPEVTTAPPAGLERPSGAAPRIDEGEAVRGRALETKLPEEPAIRPSLNLVKKLEEAGFEPVDFDSSDAYTRAGETYYTMRRGPVRLALDAGRSLGIRRGELFSSQDRSGKSVILGGLLVDPDAQRKGYAKQAMKELTGIADEVGANFALEAFPIEGGKMSAKQLEKFYSQFGFKPVGKLSYDIDEETAESYPLMQRISAKETPAPAAAPKLEVASDVEQELRAKSRAEERPGDVMLGTGQFVALDDAVKAARAVMTPQQLSSPFQFSKKLDIAPRDWDRMVEATTAAPTRIFESIEPESKAPEWVSQKVWDLHNKSIKADQAESGQIATTSPRRVLSRNATIASRRLMDAVGEYLGVADRKTPEGQQQVIDFMVRLNEESGKREKEIGVKSDIFKSIETLNRDIPDLSEQARDQAPSLRRELGKAKKDYDAGKITGDVFAETAGDLLLKTQKQRVVRPRVRGAEYIRERLLNAKRNGALTAEAADLAEWFVRQNPLLVDDLGISIRQQPEAMKGTAGFYNPVSRISTIFSGAGDTQTPVHEILHHAEQLMPANIRANILKAYTKQLTKAAKKAKTDAERAFFKAIENFQYFSEGDSYSARVNAKKEYNKALSLIKEGKVPKSHYQYASPSEFWAINGSRIVEGRYGIPPGIVGQIKKWLRDFIEKAKDLFGLTSDAAVIRALDSLAKADGKYQTRQMLAEAPAYQAVEPTAEKPKKAKPAKPKKSVLEVTKEASDKMVQPGIVRQVINKLVGPETNYENIVKKFQNVNRVVKKIQEDLRAIGKLVYVGPDKNNIDDQLSAAANRGSYIVATEVEPVAKRLRESLADYARTIQGTIKDALDKASSYRIALHEAERRETKYLRNVPLNNTTKEEFLPGEPAMTAADARMELEKRRSLTKDKAQAEALQDMIRYLVANYADSRGYSPVKARLQEAGKPTPEEMTTDFYDDIYNVIGPEYTQEELEATRQEYESLDAKTKAAVDQVFNDLDALHELNKNLNRRANYWTDKVDRVIESYGWKHYIPFKGSPKSDKTFDTDTEYLSGELSETPQSFEGRRTNFDNPILQTISESYFAASRAGRGTDVTTTIKNLIKLGVIKSKKMKKFTFEERNSPDFDYDEVRGRDKVLHYNEDGSVEVYSLKDPEVLEAIKTPFREMNLATKIGNAITGTLGQLHTRFNPAFAPMDFIRNSLTNAGLISAREGGKEARDYLTAVAANVARLGWWKSGKLSYALASNDTAELDRLAKKSPFYRDALEMMKYGGRTMYRLSFNIAETMQDIQKQIGPKKIIKDPSMFMRILDAYNDAFELTSRVAAYTVRKQQKIAEAKKQGLKVSDPKVMEDINKEAAAFALSLMDFRKIGKYGKELGAWFMFIRPAATGAVDAIDALRPGFFLKPSSVAGKAYTRLEPEIKELFETKTLAEEIKRIQGNKRPDKKKIAALEQEIVQRQKDFDAFEARQLNRAKNARNTAMFTIAAGAALYGMAAAVSGEDDEGRNRVTTDDMSRWTRYLRLPVIGDDGFFQIPWGFGVSALMSAGAQFAALARGASSFKDFAGNMVEIGMDSFLPIPTSRINPFENFGAWLIDSATPSAARPLVELVLNVDAMGNPIYNSRAGKYADAFSGSTRPSEVHRKATEIIFNTTDGEVSISPDTVAFVLNNYADGINHLAENSYNMFLTATGDKEFDAKKDTLFFRSFIGRNSNYDARKFAEAEKEIKDLAQRMKTFEDLGTPEQVLRFYQKNPNADILVDIYNKGVNGELKRLQSERKQLMLDKSLTPKERDRYVEDIRVQENYIKKLLVEDFEAYKDN